MKIVMLPTNNSIRRQVDWIVCEFLWLRGFFCRSTVNCLLSKIPVGSMIVSVKRASSVWHRIYAHEKASAHESVHQFWSEGGNLHAQMWHDCESHRDARVWVQKPIVFISIVSYIPLIPICERLLLFGKPFRICWSSKKTIGITRYIHSTW